MRTTSSRDLKLHQLEMKLKRKRIEEEALTRKWAGKYDKKRHLKGHLVDIIEERYYDWDLHDRFIADDLEAQDSLINKTRNVLDHCINEFCLPYYVHKAWRVHAREIQQSRDRMSESLMWAEEENIDGRDLSQYNLSGLK